MTDPKECPITATWHRFDDVGIGLMRLSLPQPYLTRVIRSALREKLPQSGLWKLETSSNHNLGFCLSKAWDSLPSFWAVLHVFFPSTGHPATKKRSESVSFLYSFFDQSRYTIMSAMAKFAKSRRELTLEWIKSSSLWLSKWSWEKNRF